jgi:hypothetical protein
MLLRVRLHSQRSQSPDSGLGCSLTGHLERSALRPGNARIAGAKKSYSRSFRVIGGKLRHADGDGDRFGVARSGLKIKSCKGSSVLPGAER